MFDAKVANLVRTAHRLCCEMRRTSDPERRRALAEECQNIEWRVNAMVLPRSTAPWYSDAA